MGTLDADFGDDTVVVTGGSSGIGRAIALSFGRAGATVVVADQRREPKADDAERPTHEAIAETPGRGEFVRTDVADPEQLADLMTLARELGGVDVMVNNAGIPSRSSVLDATEDEFERVLGVNAAGVLFGCQVAAKDMIDRGEPGSIVNTASISSEVAQHDQVQYDATKGAIEMVTKGTALELAAHDIRVNAIAPGQIATEFTEGWSQEAQDAAGDEEGEFIKPIPLGRAGHPEDNAGAAMFLASDAASYITGDMVFVDGGWTAI